MIYSEDSTKPDTLYRVELNEKGQRIPISPHILSKYRIAPGRQYRPSPIQITVAALLEVNKAYLIKYLKEVASRRFHGQIEAHHDFSPKLTAGEAALIERAIKMQYEALKYEFDCGECIRQFTLYKYKAPCR